MYANPGRGFLIDSCNDDDREDDEHWWNDIGASVATGEIIIAITITADIRDVCKSWARVFHCLP